jgi:transcriptional regulator with XRE-family HTH domain
MRAAWTPHTDSSRSPAAFPWPHFGIPLVAYVSQQAENVGMSQAQLNELGRVIYRQRSKAELTQRELAERAGVSHATIWHLECGDFKRPDPEKLQRIAHALNLSAGDFFASVGYTHPDHLPSLAPYLRIKFEDDLSAADRKDIERYVERKRAGRRAGSKKGRGRGIEKTRKEARA